MEISVGVIEKLHELSLEAGRGKVVQIDGRNYQIDGDGEVRLIEPIDLAQQVVKVSTLSAIVDLVKTSNERQDQQLYVQVVTPSKVSVFGHLDVYGRREKLFEASAILPEIQYGRFLDQESMIIAIQSQFSPTKDGDVLLRVAGNMKEESVNTAIDDGVSQSVQIRSGIASMAEVRVPNPVALAPYRTFTEVAQPVSNFIYRMHEQMKSALFEADGGQWQLEAMANVKEYLMVHLKDEIKSQKAVVLA